MGAPVTRRFGGTPTTERIGLDGSGGSGAGDGRALGDNFYLGDVGGAGGLSRQNVNMVIAEVAVYDRELSDSERQEVENYLLTKYAL